MPNSRCGGSCPTASPLALPLSHPLFPVPLPLHLGLPMRGGAEQSVRWLMPDGLTTLLFPVPTFSPSTPWTTNEGEAPNSRCAHARRPHCSLSFSLFPLSQPPVSGSSTSTPWTTSSPSSTLSSLTLDLTPPSARSLNLASLRGGVCVYPLESEGSVRISFHFCFTAGGHSTHHQGVANEEPGGVVLKRTCPIFNGLVIAGTFA